MHKCSKVYTTPYAALFFLDSLAAQLEMIIVRISSHLYLQILS